GDAKGGFGGGEDLFGSGGVGRDGGGAGNDGDIGGDGAEAEVVGESVGALVDVETGGIRGGVDDANLGQRRITHDALAASEGASDGSDRGETCGLPDEIIDRHTPWARWGHLNLGH